MIGDLIKQAIGLEGLISLVDSIAIPRTSFLAQTLAVVLCDNKFTHILIFSFEFIIYITYLDN